MKSFVYLTIHGLIKSLAAIHTQKWLEKSSEHVRTVSKKIYKDKYTEHDVGDLATHEWAEERIYIAGMCIFSHVGAAQNSPDCILIHWDSSGCFSHTLYLWLALRNEKSEHKHLQKEHTSREPVESLIDVSYDDDESGSSWEFSSVSNGKKKSLSVIERKSQQLCVFNFISLCSSPLCSLIPLRRVWLSHCSTLSYHYVYSLNFNEMNLFYGYGVGADQAVACINSLKLCVAHAYFYFLSRISSDARRRVLVENTHTLFFSKSSRSIPPSFRLQCCTSSKHILTEQSAGYSEWNEIEIN